MKIRAGFVSNSSSSSFVVCERKLIKDDKEMLEYLKSHEECVGYVNIDDGIYFDIKDKLRDELINNFDKVSRNFTISDGFQFCDEESFKVTEDMVGCTISISSGWDGDGCPRHIEYEDLEYDEYDDVLDFLFDDLPYDEKDEIIDKLIGNSSEEDEESEE